jgi:endonuclease/exonuclease/phosphatase family metal-dependent hydrolase
MLRLMSYNIRFGGAGREQQLAAVIREANPDIVVLQEATRPEVVERLAGMVGFEDWGSKKGHSVGFISRSAVGNYEWLYHPHIQRPVMSIDLDGVSIYGVHLRATHSNYTERGRMREVYALLDIVRDAGEGFHILAGDFNTLGPGEILSMQKLPMRYRLLAYMLGGRVNYRAIQIMLDGGYVDCYRKLHADPGFTFPAWDPHVRLDYVFAPRKHSSRVTTCDVMKNINGPAKATDHLPLIAELATE